MNKGDYDCEVDKELEVAYKKFSRQTTLSALVCKIDKDKRLMVVSDYLENTNWDDIVEAIGEIQPRFVFILCEILHKDDRKSYPISLLYYSPETSSTELNLLYSRYFEFTKFLEWLFQ